MKYTPFLVCLLIPFALFSQQPSMDSSLQQKQKTQKPEHHSIGLGVKAGFNFSNITNASMINGSSRTGFHVGLFLAPQSKSVLGSRTELIYSRSGYNYKSDTVNGAVNLDYIMLTQMMAFHITKYFDIHLGGYSAYLLSAKEDTTYKAALAGTPYASYSSVLSFYNRFDYGFGAGVELHPVAGLIIGARYQLSLSNLMKPSAGDGMTPPSVTPNFNLKNNIVLISIGYRF